jgi:hypothetical protein
VLKSKFGNFIFGQNFRRRDFQDQVKDLVQQAKPAGFRINQ